MKPRILKVSAIALLGALISGGVAASEIPAANQASSQATHESQSMQTLLGALRPAFYQTLARDAEAAYNVNERGCVTLPKQGLTACFNDAGAHFSGAVSSLNLHLVAYGRGGTLSQVKPIRPTIHANRVTYTHGNLTEWWRVLPIGFEQGFTLLDRPAGQGKLTLALATGAEASRRNGALGWGKLRYGGLVVTDATGKVIPAKLDFKGARVLIEVNDTRAAYPLTVDPLVWIEQKVVASNGTKYDQFGYSVAVDGATAVISAGAAVPIGGSSHSGTAYIFTKSNGVWTQKAQLAPNDGAPAGFGYSVAISGTTVLIGAVSATVNGNYRQGAAYVFSESDGAWTQTAKLTASDGAVKDAFGFSVALSPSGATALVGAEFADVGGNDDQGAAYVFSESNGAWTQAAKLIASDGTRRVFFGRSVGVAGTTALVGASGAGAAYVFSESNGTWTQTAKLTASGGERGNAFGISAALSSSGTTALVGADFADVGENRDQGAAYVFSESNGDWTQTAKLTASDGAARERFGASVALNGTTALIGAARANVNGNGVQGAAYVFSKSNGAWIQTKKLIASDGAAADLFGGSVALAGTIALVGARTADIGAPPDQGAAYFYGSFDLDLAMSVPGRVNPGSHFSTSTIATNSSSTTSPAVAVSIAVPAAASFLSATATQGECSEASRIVHCNFGAIAGNAGVAKAKLDLKTIGQGGATIVSQARVMHASPPLSAAAATAINHVPIAEGGRLATGQNQPASGVLTASDLDGDPLIFSIVSAPQHGGVTIDDDRKGVYTYTPDAGYVGADYFSYQANDGYADSNAAPIIINVANQPPVASDGRLTTDKNVAAEGVLDASDLDGDSLVFSIVTPPTHGSITLDATSGDYTYTPADDYFGADRFTFKVNDGQSDSNLATISVTVQGSAPPPPPPTPPSDNGGGGGFGGLLLALLALLAAAVVLIRRNRKSKALSAAANQTFHHSQRQETDMRRNWIKPATGGAIALVFALGAMPLTVYAQAAAATKGAAKTAYRAGLAMPIPADAPSPRVALAPQSDLKLLARATKLGAHAAKTTIEITVGLKLRNVAGLKAFLEQVQNPASPLYHQFLTPQQFTDLYGPTQAQVAKVTAYLEAQGIQVRNVSPNRTLIHTVGKTANYEQAFRIRINDYRLNERSFYSTKDSPKLPRAIAPMVANILGLNHGVTMRPLSHVKVRYGGGQFTPRTAPPPSTAYFNPHQIAKAYDWPSVTNPNNAAGATIAILTAQTQGVDTNANYHDFWQSYGLPDHTINVVPVGGQSARGGEIESALDIEWSGAMAPGATLRVYVAADAKLATFADMYNQFVTDNAAQVMTTSWGASEPAALDQFVSEEQIFMQAAAQGISMFAASGDHGASDCAPPPGYCPPGANNADFPSSSEYITAANGTELSISDTSGTYGSEHAWAGTGGAVSQLFDKPVWQTGPGVPADVDMRMNSDMALNAGGLHPYMVLVAGPQGTGYYGISGTSAVAPIFAGLFAIGVSEQPGGASLGQSNSLIYNDVNANDGNYVTDFHDVTTGCNGYLPDGTTQSCAAANWDHPTGWGSPKATSLLSHLGVHGPAGTVKGTVTDAKSGAPIVGAIITAASTDFSVDRTTGDDGSYSVLLPVGGYTVSVRDFGYGKKTTSVSIADGDSTTQDFTLEVAPTATLSGTVSDGSGHGYGLYTEIKARVSGFGQVADVWSDPATGKYSVELPEGFDYTLIATAAFNGYQPASTTLNLANDSLQDFALKVADVCTAPGYAAPFSEDFNTKWPPDGWTVINADAPQSWQPNLNWGVDNWTGGTGLAAEADSAGIGAYDTSLVSPPIAVSSLAGDALLRYKANVQPSGTAQKLDLDISSDDGDTWTNLLHWVTNTCGGFYAAPGCDVQFNLGSYLPAQGDFQLRWRFHGRRSFFAAARYAQVDAVQIGACQPVAGGLVFGQVTDANSGAGVIWASIQDDLGNQIHTTSNPADPAFPAGGYLLFAPAGDRTLTASDYNYQTATAAFTMTNNAITVQNFMLKSGRLTSDPDHLALHVMVNNQVSQALAIGNTGSVVARYHIVTGDAPPPVTATAHASAGAPTIRIKGDYSPLRLMPSRVERDAHPHGGSVAHSSFWNTIANYPVPIMDNAMARDPTTDLIYSVGGLNSGGYVTDAYAYDPATDTWSLVTRLPIGRAAPQVAFIDGKLYVVGGWNQANTTRGTVATLGIYDPAAHSWTAGAGIPAAYAGAGHAVVNGKLYVVGGCQKVCESVAVQIYDPANNTWSQASDYPHPVAWESCGGIDGKLYCVGGTSVSRASMSYKDGYVYDPATDQWSPIRDMPMPLWGSGYAAANGMLVVSGGIFGFKVLTNAGYAYDPSSDQWQELPNSKYPVYRGGSVCGFFRVGGTDGKTPGTPEGEQLPGYAQCGKPTPVFWLTLSPASGTVAAGDTAQANLIIDGTGQQEFATSQVYLKLLGNTPYPDKIVPVTVTWDPQPVNLVLSGEVGPESVRKGHDLTYTVTVTNRQANNHGPANDVTLTYTLPKGVSYETATGGATACTAAEGFVTCEFGTIALGDSKTETLAVKAGVAGKLSSSFNVSAREPESHGDDNHLSLTSVVIGTADLALGADSASIPAGGTGALTLTLKNAGPDPASEVQIHATLGSNAISLQSASVSQGNCSLADGGVACKLGQLDVGKTVTVTLKLFGSYVGSATLNAQASSASDESNPDNNGITAKVTVKAPPPPDNGGGNGGGGAFGGLALAALLSFGLGAGLRRRHRTR